MPQSLDNALLHLVFSTKDRFPCLGASVRPALHASIIACGHSRMNTARFSRSMGWLSMNGMCGINRWGGLSALNFCCSGTWGVAPGWYRFGALPLMLCRRSRSRAIPRGREPGTDHGIHPLSRAVKSCFEQPCLERQLKNMEETAGLGNHLTLSFKTPKEAEYIRFLWEAFQTDYARQIPVRFSRLPHARDELRLLTELRSVSVFDLGRNTGEPNLR